MLAEHVFSEDHRIAWEVASILDHHYLQLPQLMVESWYINKVPDTLNREKSGMGEFSVALGGSVLTFGFFLVLDRFFSPNFLNGHRPLSNT